VEEEFGGGDGGEGDEGGHEGDAVAGFDVGGEEEDIEVEEGEDDGHEERARLAGEAEEGDEAEDEVGDEEIARGFEVFVHGDVVLVPEAGDFADPVGEDFAGAGLDAFPGPFFVEAVEGSELFRGAHS